jgi:hypothetical protein
MMTVRVAFMPGSSGIAIDDKMEGIAGGFWP